ncbi:MAG: phosphotransferase family protein [Gammaproteobacteria bacterium]|nr:phosphotransferase family protein [Gammaproteobacteria bacterium]
MSADTQHVIDAIAALDVWPDEKTRVRQRLGDGPTNETWLVTCDQEPFVLRLVKPFAATVGLSLEDELQIVQAAQRENLTPAIVAACNKRGIVLRRYVEGRIWNVNDVRDKKQLARLAHTVKKIHDLECEARPMDLRSTLESYAKLSSDPESGKWLDTALNQLNRISARDPVVCHNDLTAANIIDYSNATKNGSALWNGDTSGSEALVDNDAILLLDWEYAARGDPLFDLAVVIVHYDLDVSMTGYFLSAYLGQADDSAGIDLNRWCNVYSNLLSLWLSLDDNNQAHFKRR